jgi:hypothetical protein
LWSPPEMSVMAAYLKLLYSPPKMIPMAARLKLPCSWKMRSMHQFVLVWPNQVKRNM